MIKHNKILSIQDEVIFNAVCSKAENRIIILDALMQAGGYINARLSLVTDNEYGELLKENSYYHKLLDDTSGGGGPHYIDPSKPFYIYICTFDPFGKGLPIYSFNSKTFFNITADISDLPYTTQNMIEYFNSGIISDRSTMAIDAAVRQAIARERLRNENLFTFIADDERLPGSGLYDEDAVTYSRVAEGDVEY